MSEFIRIILSKTLVLTKTLDFFEDFKIPGEDYKIVACQASEELTKKYPNIYVDEIAEGLRAYATSKQLLKILQNYIEIEKLLDCDYIWTYQAYSWTNDLKYSGKNIFSIDYYLFLKLQNKLIQRKLFIEHTSKSKEKLSFLRNNLMNSSKVLDTKIFPKQKVKYEYLKKNYNSDFVVCASNSNGGEGVFKISNAFEYEEALRSINTPVIRTEKFIDNGIPLNQIGFIMSNGMVIKYKPSIQIIKNIHQSNKMEYAGCDFSCDNYLSNCFETLISVTELTHNVGKILYTMGYRGTFGCDYLIVDDNIHFIELNPRYQASTLIPNLHLGSHQVLAPHILHILGFIDFYLEQFPELNKYKNSKQFIDFIQEDKPIGFLNLYEKEIATMRKPLNTVKIEEGISKGYVLFKKSIIKSPYYPTKLNALI